MILCSNPHAQYLAHKREIDAAVLRVMEGGRYILGGEVQQLECEFASFVESRHAIGVGNGTDALCLALKACGIGPGDEVITVAHTAVATVAAIVMTGAEPVFADIDPAYYTLDPATLPSLIGDRTRAVVPVHLYGQSADMASILAIAERHGLHVVEDCAQAHGATFLGRPVGSLGALASFSFYPTKNLGAIGDGGLVVARQADAAATVRKLRQYGWNEERLCEFSGCNSRLDEMQAAILRVKLAHLDADNALRAAVADLYRCGLASTDLLLPDVREGCRHVYHQFVVRASARDGLLAHLNQKGIGALVHYPVPAHLHPAYEGRFRGGANLPETERAAREILSLPIYPEITAPEVQRVIESVTGFFR